MPSKKPPPRKKPQQARAQQTVHAILEATVQVLEREGPEAATTTRIAEVAGVSVGTLYQYFSHRDAIFDALQDTEDETPSAATWPAWVIEQRQCMPLGDRPARKRTR